MDYMDRLSAGVLGNPRGGRGTDHASRPRRPYKEPPFFNYCREGAEGGSFIKKLQTEL